MATREQVKKNAVAQASKKKKTSAKEYFKGIKVEMSKVVWPTKKELTSYTAVVIATCAVFALGFWLIDTGFLAALKAVLNITLN
ncbi:MAG: preprotein translocase subunit SecE [Eubacteriales bacterium]|jgi:preprotein translocase subunit SecE|nr:preprotein translocase subunit SecE [Eubacteriales bacterium]